MKISIRDVNTAKTAIEHIKSNVTLPATSIFKINNFIKNLKNLTASFEETAKELHSKYKGEAEELKEEDLKLLNQEIDLLLNEEVELSVEPLSISVFGDKDIPLIDAYRNGQAIKANPIDFLENFLSE